MKDPDARKQKNGAQDIVAQDGPTSENMGLVRVHREALEHDNLVPNDMASGDDDTAPGNGAKNGAAPEEMTLPNVDAADMLEEASFAADATLTPEQRAAEAKQIRRMQMMFTMVMQVIAQDASLSVDAASAMIADARRAALNLFPEKELAYNLIWKPRFQRLMRERFHLN
jgi:hypothetical protein